MIALAGLVGIATIEVVRRDVAAVARAAGGDARAAVHAEATRAHGRARAAQYVLVGLTAVALGVGGALVIRRATELDAQVAHTRLAYDRAQWARAQVDAVADELHGQAQLVGRAAARLLARPGQPGDVELVRIQNASAQLEHAVAVLVRAQRGP